MLGKTAGTSLLIHVAPDCNTAGANRVSIGLRRQIGEHRVLAKAALFAPLAIQDVEWTRFRNGDAKGFDGLAAAGVTLPKLVRSSLIADGGKESSSFPPRVKNDSTARRN
jgi:hypothetical protein